MFQAKFGANIDSDLPLYEFRYIDTDSWRDAVRAAVAEEVELNCYTLIEVVKVEGEMIGGTHVEEAPEDSRGSDRFAIGR